MPWQTINATFRAPSAGTASCSGGGEWASTRGAPRFTKLAGFLLGIAPPSPRESRFLPGGASTQDRAHVAWATAGGILAASARADKEEPWTRRGSKPRRRLRYRANSARR